MKKQLVSVLLVVCMVAALFSGLSVSAYADVDISKDTVQGYLVAHTVVKGETMAKICAAMGVDYNSNATAIARYNPGVNLSNIRIGQEVWIPQSAPSTTASYYTLYVHVAVSGDTHYKVSRAYGTNDSTALYKSLNDVNKKLYVGDKMIIPVLTKIAAATPVPETTTAPSTETPAPGSATTPVPGATTTPAPTATTTPGSSTATTGDGIMGYVISYTVKAGDTLNKVCTSLGVNYYTYKNIIAKINNLSNLNSIKVGQKLWLVSNSVPDKSVDYYTLHTHVIVKGETLARIAGAFNSKASDPWIPVFNTISLNPIYPGNVIIIPEKNGPVVSVAPSGSSGSSGSAGSSSSGGSSAGSTGTATTPAATPAADKVAFYLVKHEMKKGETVNSVCNSMGVRFANYSTLIQKVNGISSWTSIPVGKVLLLPSTSAPTDGGYKIVAHTVVSGDTVNKLCTSYGIKYSAYTGWLQALNPSVSNLSSIRVGQVLNFPVPVASGSSATPATETSDTVEVRQTITTDAKHPAGATIRLSVREKNGYTFSKITAIAADGTAITLTKDSATGTYSFKMPAQSVTITVTYKKN